jgi:hypothetical protein
MYKDSYSHLQSYALLSSLTLSSSIDHSLCFGIRGDHGKSAFKLVVKLPAELGYVFLSLRL